MRDVEDGHPARLEAGDDPEQPVDLRWGQRRGRLVEDQHLALGGERFGDLQQLHLGHTERLHPRPRRDLQPDLREHGLGIAEEPREVHPPGPIRAPRGIASSSPGARCGPAGRRCRDRPSGYSRGGGGGKPGGQASAAPERYIRSVAVTSLTGVLIQPFRWSPFFMRNPVLMQFAAISGPNWSMVASTLPSFTSFWMAGM